MNEMIAPTHPAKSHLMGKLYTAIKPLFLMKNLTECDEPAGSEIIAKVEKYYFPPDSKRPWQAEIIAMHEYKFLPTGKHTRVWILAVSRHGMKGPQIQIVSFVEHYSIIKQRWIHGG